MRLFPGQATLVLHYPGLTWLGRPENNAAHRPQGGREGEGGIAMRRLGVIVALGALLGMFGGAVTASPALAGRGPKWQVFSSRTFTLPAGACGFRVRVKPVASKEFIKVLKTADGSMTELVTGKFKQSYTNLSTGKAITENASSSAKLTTNADHSGTLVARGRTPNFFTPAEARRFGLPTVSILAGRLAISIGPAGFTSVSLHGHVLVDVCAALS